ncbi:MAG: hypothetical protein K0R15_1951 [Clostridiales bacterium]|jgi:uncharacterized beta-barrel protein YwiB (DUF1934 family)|nr:hypothetical protein [Clostridiales bacterium]
MDDVTVTVTGRQIDLDPTPVVVVARGKYRLENDIYYVEYTETETESGNIIINKIVANMNKVIINRSGAINSILQFETQRKNAVEYETQYGVLSMDIITKDINISVVGNQINIVVDYYFEMNGEHVSRNSLSIEINQ